MKTYKICVNENQLRLIMNALESYFRLRMGQFFDYCNDVAANGYVYDKTNPDNDKLFDAYIERRNNSKEMFEEAYRVAAPNLYERKKTPAMQNAIDIWHVIRHIFYLERPEPKDHYTTDAYPPHQTGEEPLPTVERISE